MYGMSIKEYQEFQALKNKIFGNDMFVQIDEGEQNKEYVKRYEELLAKKMEFLKKREEMRLKSDHAI